MTSTMTVVDNEAGLPWSSTVTSNLKKHMTSTLTVVDNEAGLPWSFTVTTNLKITYDVNYDSFLLQT